MSLFTSNFRAEARVLLSVAVVLLASEVVLRITVERLSGDVRNTQRVPLIAKSFRANRSGTVLFLGNSLTQRGVDLGTIAESLSAMGYPGLHLSRVHPDDTALLDWYYTFKWFFLETQSAPEVLVIGFARSQMDDTALFHAERIAHYCGLTYVHELFAEDLPDVDARANYLLAATSATFSQGPRARLLILKTLVPGYRTTAHVVNQAVRHEYLDKAAMGSNGNTLNRLTRMLLACRQANVMPVIVAMPLPDMYSVNPHVAAMVEASRGAFIDLRRIPGLDETCYLDGFHLNPRGSVIYSTALARRLALVLAAQGKPAMQTLGRQR